VNDRRLLFFEPEGEHAAAAVTAGMSMVGLRATNFSSGQGIAYMHESLYAAAGKRPAHLRAEHRGARHDQARPQRARGPR
jgi:pyruvate/2-oxoacid:ferredoxin oxidoreductase alpha subunit